MAIRHKALRVTNTLYRYARTTRIGGLGLGRQLAGEGAGGKKRSSGGLAAAASEQR
jgi:hypothetical protein